MENRGTDSTRCNCLSRRLRVLSIRRTAEGDHCLGGARRSSFDVGQVPLLILRCLVLPELDKRRLARIGDYPSWSPLGVLDRLGRNGTLPVLPPGGANTIARDP